MSNLRTDPFYARNPRSFGCVEEVVVRRGKAEQAVEKLRPFSATGAKAISHCIEEVSSNRPNGDTIDSASAALQHRPFDLRPWDARQGPSSTGSSGAGAASSSAKAKNPFAKNSVTSHLPHVAKSTTIRRVPLAHLGLAMEMDDTVGLPHQSSWSVRDEQRAADFGQFLVRTMNERFPNDDDDADDDADDAVDDDFNDRKRSGRRDNSNRLHHHRNYSANGGDASAATNTNSRSIVGATEQALFGEEVTGNSSRASGSRASSSPTAQDEIENVEPRVDSEGREGENENEDDDTTMTAALRQAARRTKSTYLSGLQSTQQQQQRSFRMMVDAQKLQKAELNQKPLILHDEAMKRTFQQLAVRQREEAAAVPDDEIHMKKLLVMMYQENIRNLMMMNQHALQKQQDDGEGKNAVARCAVASDAMQDIAPPSSGFENSGGKNQTNSSRERKRSPPLSTTTPLVPLSASANSRSTVVNTLASGRGFFLNGKQRDDLVRNQIIIGNDNKSHHREQGTGPSSTSPPASTCSPHQQNRKQQLEENNACKYHPDTEAQRAIYRSWQFRDKLHIRHSVKASHLPKKRRTIVNNVDPASPTNQQWSDVILGVPLTTTRKTM